MEIKFERITKLTITNGGNIALDFDSNTRRIYTTNDLRDKINNLIGGLEIIKRTINQSQSQIQSQIQNRIDIDNTLNDIESSVKQVRKLLNL